MLFLALVADLIFIAHKSILELSAVIGFYPHTGDNKSQPYRRLKTWS
jgi:hypothetical protein